MTDGGRLPVTPTLQVRSERPRPAAPPAHRPLLLPVRKPSWAAAQFEAAGEERGGGGGGRRAGSCSHGLAALSFEKHAGSCSSATRCLPYCSAVGSSVVLQRACRFPVLWEAQWSCSVPAASHSLQAVGRTRVLQLLELRIFYHARGPRGVRHGACRWWGRTPSTLSGTWPSATTSWETRWRALRRCAGDARRPYLTEAAVVAKQVRSAWLAMRMRSRVYTADANRSQRMQSRVNTSDADKCEYSRGDHQRAQHRQSRVSSGVTQHKQSRVSSGV